MCIDIIGRWAACLVLPSANFDWKMLLFQTTTSKLLSFLPFSLFCVLFVDLLPQVMSESAAVQPPVPKPRVTRPLTSPSHQQATAADTEDARYM